MPIRPENRDRYPPDWAEIRERVRTRAGDRCELCQVGNHWIGYRESGGAFVLTGFNEKLAQNPASVAELHPHPIGFGKLEIVCTVAHLDHQPENCADDNLAFLCQRCHLAHDQVHHQQTAYTTRREGRAAGDLFDDEPRCGTCGGTTDLRPGKYDEDEMPW